MITGPPDVVKRQNRIKSGLSQVLINQKNIIYFYIQNPSFLNTEKSAWYAIILLAVIMVYPQRIFATDERYTSPNWTAETIALDEADRAATEYAENNFGVGILIHLGQDVPNQRIRNGDELGQLFVDRFTELGTEARYFIAPNDDGRATVMTYHIGHLLYKANGNPVFDLQTAWDDAPEVIKQLKLVKQLSR